MFDLSSFWKQETKNGIPLQGPVGWLLSRQLISTLRGIVLNATYGEKLDHRDWMHSAPLAMNPGWGEAEYWFDYISDTGDGQLATYNVAYLAQSDLWLSGPRAARGERAVSVTQETGFTYQLPRGSFLFVGGDSAYHAADHGTLALRFQIPFNWAYDEVFSKTDAPAPETRRPIVAIPANHDYYDSLDGFSRQFRKTIDPEPYNPDHTSGPQLSLKGFYRVQTASYVALQLPYDWWILGIDAEKDKIDKRQTEFFKHCRGAAQEGAVPAKLIVATPVPTTVTGAWNHVDSPLSQTFQKLGLAQAFLQGQDGRLAAGQCRLDISGDTHHYARYWGQGVHGDDPGTSRPNYASVVAGGGGAFLHPTYTDRGEVPENRIYPEQGLSFQHIMRHVLNPAIIAGGGLLWLAGMLVALSVYFAVTVPESTWALFSNHDVGWLQLVDGDRRPANLGSSGLLNGVLRDIQGVLWVKPSPHLFGLLWMAVSSMYFFEFAYVVFLMWFLLAWLERRKGELTALNDNRKLPHEAWHNALRPFILRCLLAGLPMLALVLFGGKYTSASLLNGLLAVLYLVIAVLSLRTSLWYSGLMLERAVRHHVSRWDALPQRLFAVFALISLCYGAWRFGSDKLSIMLTEITALSVFALLAVGIYFLAVAIGAKRVKNAEGKRIFRRMGLWHLALQLLTPLLLCLYGNVWTILLALAVVGAAAIGLGHWSQALDESTFNARRAAHAERIWRFWLAVGSVVLLIALAGRYVDGTAEVTFWRVFLLAPVLGALFSCVWFGWYIAATALYNGHNNEAGGAALSDHYRHLVRIRLTADDLTAYVIGVDEPRDLAAGQKPRFRLVDVFTLRCR